MVGQLTSTAEERAQRLQGRAEHHPAADGQRRRRDGLAAAAPGRGGQRGAAERRRRSPARDKAFYEGKVAAAKWFARNVLPPVLRPQRALAESVDLDLMDLPEEAF